MKLNQVLRGVALTGCRADQDVEITGVSYCLLYTSDAADEL